jgi:hypothetical protein
MRTDHDFSVDQFIAEAPALRRLDDIAAGVRIPMHEMSVQDAHVRLMYLRYQAMWLEPDFGVNAMRAFRVQDSSEEMAWRVGGAQCGGADPKEQDGARPRP